MQISILTKQMIPRMIFLVPLTNQKLTIINSNICNKTTIQITHINKTLSIILNHISLNKFLNINHNYQKQLHNRTFSTINNRQIISSKQAISNITIIIKQENLINLRSMPSQQTYSNNLMDKVISKIKKLK